MSQEVLLDKIRGGLLGELLGNLNGLKHEMKYLKEPGNVTEYIPALPEGARTDDDTDFEWVYIYAMQQENEIFLSPERIAQLWKNRINRRIWCANQYARQLMDIGLVPPQTGDDVFNPWAEFNISGQFLCEAFGLISPCMPQTAARIGLNYTRAAICGEPAQTTQFFTTMIATAFLTSNMEEILDAGVASLDPKSEIKNIVQDIIQWHKQYPQEWRTTRRLLKEKYAHFGGEPTRDRNGYELNTGSIIAALLYGQGKVDLTLQMAFNFGWDADCNAATAGTIVGVIKGYRSMLAQGWQIVDRYKNTTRQSMPMDETITSHADRLIELAERLIIQNKGERVLENGRPVYKINTETAKNVKRLPELQNHIADLQSQYKDEIENGILRAKTKEERARAAYLAISLDLAHNYKEKYSQQWKVALQDLTSYWNVVQAIYYYSDSVPLGKKLQDKANAAGLVRPAKRRSLWE